MNSNIRPHRWYLKANERRSLLLLGDIVITALALLIALYFWAAGDAWMDFSIEFIRTRPPFWYFLLPVLWLVLLIELYDLRRAGSVVETLKSIGLAVLICGLLYLLAYFTSEPNSLPRIGVAAFIVVVAVLEFIWRFLYIKLFTRNRLLRQVLIIGAGKAGTTLVNIFNSQRSKPFNLVGLIDDDPAKTGSLVEGFEILGTHQDLLTLIEEHEVSDLVLAIMGKMDDATFQSILTAQEAGITLTSMAETYEEMLGRVPIHLLEADWVIRSFVEKVNTGTIYRFSKRALDILGGLIGLLILIIILPFVALLMLIDSGMPIFYKQERLGRGGNVYTIYKFRTMRKDAEKNGEVQVTSKRDPRITRLGHLLRKMHIDEIPQFINVLEGNMSLVGPRSERAELVAVFQKDIPFYRARLLVKPGMTGWAQINYDYAETVAQTAIKLEYDLYYIEHRNFFMDMVIMIRTMGAVFGFKGR
jgi:exopolysaccharide biosynthesis polyprenyl glycosylphosphotransferase